MLKSNSRPVFLMKDSFFESYRFNGTIYVNNSTQDCYIGIACNYQSNRKFIAIVWSNSEANYSSSQPFVSSKRKGIQVKVVNSSTGPGPTLRNALWHSGNVTDEVKITFNQQHYPGAREILKKKYTHPFTLG